MTHPGAGCEWGHERHDTVVVAGHGPAEGLEFEVFVPPGEDRPGYCPASSVVSTMLTATGEWEPEQTAALLPHLVEDIMFLDFGANVGWYSLLALARGGRIRAWEGNWFTSRLLRRNCLWADDRWVLNGDWIAVPPEEHLLDLGDPVVFKSDLEGYDEHAVNGCWHLFEAHQITAALIEMSPVFRPGYPELAQRLVDAGYDGWSVKPDYELLDDPVAYVRDCRQADVLWLPA